MKAVLKSCRENAERLRTIAAGLRGKEKQELLAVADAYERLAAKAEE